LSPILVVRPHISGYVYAGIFGFFAVVVWVIAQAMGSIKSHNDLIVAWLVFGAFALVVIYELLCTAMPRVIVDGGKIQVRDLLGRHRSFTRSDVSHAAMRSILVPRRFGGYRSNAFLIVGKDGRCLARLPEEDYDPRALERLVETLGLEWPQTENSSVRRINREFPGAFAFDHQALAVVLLMILGVALATLVAVTLHPI
jgi:hypothetical protein